MKPEEYLKSYFGLEGKVAVVIGGTGELCGAMAEGLAGAGAEVVIVGRNLDKAQATLGNIAGLAKQSGADAKAYGQALQSKVADLQKGADAGADAYLPKPFDIATFIEYLNTMLRLHYGNAKDAPQR